MSKELAGPPSLSPGPVTRIERIASIDILRGIALLWILFSNIDIFSGPETLYEIPQWLPNTTFVNAHLPLNLFILFFKWITTEGKDRFLFSMLFGVGLCLMDERAERTGSTKGLADTYLRRNLWLSLFGLLHGILLWAGDILLSYGLAGLLFLYPCRKLKARTLLLAGALLTCASTPILPYFLGTAGDVELSQQGHAVIAARQAGTTLTPDQVKIEEQWQALQAAHAVAHTPPPIDGRSAPGPAMPFFTTVAGQFHNFFTEPLMSRTFILMEVAGAMLFGMGLYKIGFLTAQCSWATYGWCAFLGLLLSAPFYAVGMWKVYQSQFDFITVDIWLYRPYEVLKFVSGVGMLSLLMLFIKSSMLRRVKVALAAVGSMALSNYILTSLICQYLFLWSPWALYGRLTYIQHHFVMLAIWALNIILSVLWLRAFQFGPLEWIWRSLTYWKLQPMRLKAKAA